MVSRTRRNLLALVALGAGSVVGCVGDGSGGETPTTGADTPTATTHTPTDTTDAPTPPTGTPTGSRTKSTTPREGMVPIGHLIEGERVDAVVRSSATRDTVGSGQAAEGHTFVVVRLVMKNVTDDRDVFFATSQNLLLVAGEKAFRATPRAEPPRFQGGRLVPGEVDRGDVTFEVPTSVTDPSLRFQLLSSSLPELDGVSIDLSARAGRVADVEQTLAVPIHDVGESVPRDGIEVTVHAARFAESIGDSGPAPDGREYAIVDLATANETDDRTVISRSDVAMKDGRGRSFTNTIATSGYLPDEYPFGIVAAGEQVRGRIAMEVPTGASPLYVTSVYGGVATETKTFWRLR